MPVIVDGNNLLHAARRAEIQGPEIGRSLMCEALRRWMRQRREEVHIVFDGAAPRDERVRQIGGDALRISFAGQKTADALLIQILETDSAARRLVVVSSDREIARAARRRRATAIRSDEFWALVQRDLARPPRKSGEPPEKRRGLEPGQAGAWLAEFGFAPADAGEAEDEERRVTP